jgi:hypothetical protein
LTPLRPFAAAPTTELAVAGPVQYLAVWRLPASIDTPVESGWERVRRKAQPGPPYLYVPAFSLARAVVQRLGTRLVEAQPLLQLMEGLPQDIPARPSLVAPSGVDGRDQGDITAPVVDHAMEIDALGQAPDFGRFSPVVVGRQDARVLSHFIYLALVSHEVRDLSAVEYRLTTAKEDLVLLPAVWDPRYIHESSWRLLLREFDDLVA